MAKRKITLSYTKSKIDKGEDVIVEELKDGQNVHSLSELIDKINLIEGVSITVAYDEEIVPKSVEY